MEYPSSRLSVRAFCSAICLAVAVWIVPIFAKADEAVYADSLQNGWVSWSWDASIDFGSSTQVHSGSKGASVTLTAPWAAIYLHHDAMDSSPYTNLTFWIHGGISGGQQLQLQAELSGVAQPGLKLPGLTKAWQKISISLTELGVGGKPDLDGFWLQDVTGKPQPTFYLDDVLIQAGVTPAVPAMITVDAQRNRHPISPLIYGVAFASAAQLADLNAPLNRSGGNAETRYNWQLNAHNHAADWYFESLPDTPATAGAAGDDFVMTSKNGGAEPMLTIPMIGWLPKLGANRGRLASYSIAKYGPQTGKDAQWFPDAGNGISSTNGNAPITWNDANDANVLTDSSFQQLYVQHLTNRWQVSDQGGVRYYLMDNEPSLWQSTHRDVHPLGPAMQEIRDKFFDYAGMVKGIDPGARVLGPEEWGWSGYFYSGKDQQWSGARNDWNPAHFPDRTANGGWDYVPWLLDQFRQRATQTNQRLLDYCTVHIYPQGGEFGQDTSATIQELRNRSTRSLWDPAYVDQSWIGTTVKLIPRLRDWVAAYYPGTRIGITEYNWGAEAHINGATAQADILGIFGRENLDLATRWTTPESSTPAYKAMKLFRNYDDKHSTFGDISVYASGMNPDNVSSFASVRSSDRALTVVIINKQLATTASLAIALTNFSSAGTAQVWQLTSANLISRLADNSFTGNSLSNSFPPQSITLLVLSAAQFTPSPPYASAIIGKAGHFTIRFLSLTNQVYRLEMTESLAPASWSVISNNMAGTGNWIELRDLDATRKSRFFRVAISP